MDGIVSKVKVNINALLLHTMLYYKWGHAVMDDVIYRTRQCALILMIDVSSEDSGQYFGKLAV